MASSKQNNVFTNRLYDQLKFVALILLPGVSSLYFGLAAIWNFPNAEKVIGTITLIDTFLGVVLHLSNAQYYKNDNNFSGTLHVTTENPPQVLADFNHDPAELVGQALGPHERQHGQDLGGAMNAASTCYRPIVVLIVILFLTQGGRCLARQNGGREGNTAYSETLSLRRIMFTLKLDREPTGLETAIDNLLKELAGPAADSNEYAKMVDQLVKLHGLKTNESPRRPSPDALISAAGKHRRNPADRQLRTRTCRDHQGPRYPAESQLNRPPELRPRRRRSRVSLPRYTASTFSWDSQGMVLFRRKTGRVMREPGPSEQYSKSAPNRAGQESNTREQRGSLLFAGITRRIMKRIQIMQLRLPFFFYRRKAS
jgi:hypothetical protein